jgi:hypothetical protein
MSCGGDASTDLPPWGLDTIDMPDSVEEVQATIAALPDEIDGRIRSGGAVLGGSAGVMYGEEGIFWIVQVQPTEQIEMLGMPGVSTPTDWLESVGSGRAGGVLEETALSGSLLWVTRTDEWETAPGQMDTAYLLDWAQPGGDFTFFIQAGSGAGRVALVDAFITAAGG